MTPILLAFALALPTADAKPGGSISLADSDGDGVKDLWDVCSGSDDTVDLDANSVPDCSESFVVDPMMDHANARFRWIGNQVPSMLGVDANGYAGSDAVGFTLSSAWPSSSMFSDCTPITQGDDHVLVAQVQLSTPAPSPRMRVAVFEYASLSDCQNIQNIGYQDIDLVTGPTSWGVLGGRFTPDPATTYVEIVYTAYQSPGQATDIDVGLDNVNLHDLGVRLGDPGDPGTD